MERGLAEREVRKFLVESQHLHRWLLDDGEGGFHAAEAVCHRRASSLPIAPRYLPLGGLTSSGHDGNRWADP